MPPSGSRIGLVYDPSWVERRTAAVAAHFAHDSPRIGLEDGQFMLAWLA